MTRENLTELISAIPALTHLPVVADCDSGTRRLFSPCRLAADVTVQVRKNKVSIVLSIHG